MTKPIQNIALIVSVLFMASLAPLQAARDYEGKELVEVFDKVPNIGKVVISYIGYKGQAGYTALYWSIALGYSACVRYLVQQGLDVHARCYNGTTALHWSAREGHLDCLKYLVMHGADLEATTYTEETAMDLASRYGHQDVLQFLANPKISIHGVSYVIESAYGRSIIGLR